LYNVLVHIINVIYLYNSLAVPSHFLELIECRVEWRVAAAGDCCPKNDDENDPLTTTDPQSVARGGSPFSHRAFTVIWIATVVSNIGGWMSSVASGWLMTSLNSNAFIVSMVQVANSLPMFLFAIPAGALADIVNQRRFLIVGESTITIVSIAFAALIWLHLITPVSLLFFISLLPWVPQ
jgi:hypothetical protein